MSPQDVDTQKKMFKIEHQRAVVIDPISYDFKAFKLDLAHPKEASESGYAIIDFKE
jgi:hypothetical protein